MTTKSIQPTPEVKTALSGPQSAAVFREQKKRDASVKSINSLVTVFQQLSQGVPPSNKQLISVMNRTSRGIEKAKTRNTLDKKSINILTDTGNFVDATRDILEKKNNDQILQSIFVNSLITMKNAQSKYSRENLASRIKTNKAMLQSSRQSLVNLISIIYASKEVREMAVELIDILYKSFQKGGETGIADPIVQSVKKQRRTFEGLKQTGRNLKFSVEAFMKGDTAMDPEAKKIFKTRFAQFVTTLQENPQYKSIIENIFNLISTLKDDVYTTSKTAGRISDSLFAEAETRKALHESQDFIQRFLHEKSLDPLIQALKRIVAKVQADKELNRQFSNLHKYLETVLNDPESMENKEIRKRGYLLFQKISKFLPTYRNDETVKFAITEFRDIIKQLKSDSLLKNWITSTRKLSQNFYYIDSKGRFHPDYSVLRRIAHIVSPLLAEQLKYVPIPNMSGSDKVYDWTASNMIFNGYDILPDFIKFQSDFKWRVSFLGYKEDSKRNEDGTVREPYDDFTSGRFVILLEGIRARMRDIMFSFTRKKFPKITDSGLARVKADGKGARIRITLDMNTTDPNAPLFSGGAVKVKLDRLRVKVSRSKHNFLYNTATTLFNGSIKKQIEQSAANAISDKLAQITLYMNILYSKIPFDDMKSNIRSRVKSIMA